MKKIKYGIMLGVLFCSIPVYAESCSGLLGSELISEIKDVLRIIQIAAPVIFALLTAIDFAKVVFSDNKDGMKKAKDNFIKRAVATMIIFFAPMIISLILSLVELDADCVSTLG